MRFFLVLRFNDIMYGARILRGSDGEKSPGHRRREQDPEDRLATSETKRITASGQTGARCGRPAPRGRARRTRARA